MSRQLIIVIKTDSGWEELHGHGCKTPDEMVDYVNRFNQRAGVEMALSSKAVSNE